MDLMGQIVDTKISIKPSSQFVQYIKKLQYEDGMPENIAKILNGADYEVYKKVRKVENVNIKLSFEDLALITKLKKELNNNSNQNTEQFSEKKDGIYNDVKEINVNEGNTKLNKNNAKDADHKNSDLHFIVSDIDWLYTHLKKLKCSKGTDIPYLHELLEGCELKTPANAVLKRNPELEARCVKLRAQQEAREYRSMTKGVDNVRIRFPEDSISYQLKQLNRQLIAVGQFLLSIFAGFLFGFKGLELMIGGIDFGFRLLLGVMCALIIALAEIYFLAKKLNEELSIPETTQLGGPPKFASRPDDPKSSINNVDKEHQD